MDIPSEVLPDELVYRATNLALIDMRGVGEGETDYDLYLASAISWCELSLVRLKNARERCDGP
jgi:hypothetical protein